ncbi:coiled-coil domain-containing protein [Flavisphingomonas formosensis]|uniref:hypothetical protein n=1 Tax=Flavisphingomonas formosensis TaxID=861534 RepID=UPI0012FCD81D|nr:hypothetical protein [Sphingomonas formosensis]
MVPSTSERIVAMLVGLAAIAWVTLVIWTALAPPAGPTALPVSWIATASGPIAAIGVLWLLTRRTSRVEARRFERTSAGMRREAHRLEEVVSRLSAQIAENRRLLGEQAHQLLLIGEDANHRLAEIGEKMRADTATLASQSEKVEQTAAAARADMVALLGDLPRAEESARDVAERLRAAGDTAGAQSELLQQKLAALSESARIAGEDAGSAAQRLAAGLADLDRTGGDLGKRIDETAAAMSTTVDGALVKAADALEAARQGIAEHHSAMLAMLEQGQAAIADAGHTSSSAFSRRMDNLVLQIQSLETKLTAQDASAAKLVTRLNDDLAYLEKRFAALAETGSEKTSQLSANIGALREQAEDMRGLLASGALSADAVIGRADALKAAIDACVRELDQTLPLALARLEEQATHSHAAAAAAAPEVARLENSAHSAAKTLAESHDELARQRSSQSDFATATERRIAALQRQTENLETALTRISTQAQQISDTAGPKLIEALLRVRETAHQATERAKETLATIIPTTVEALGEASGAALRQALGNRVEARMEEISSASGQAVDAVDAATERLMRQLLTISDTTAAIEARIAAAKAEAEERERNNFSRRVALLIESLNSTAIDVAKILSNEVTDSAWAAYLKGDRGIFTRRAVKLLDTGEAREIVRHYESDLEFRDQVNRYIHDFEGMIRRVLSEQDGTPLGVTLLSSDMGKLYVALAQAIERLRS